MDNTIIIYEKGTDSIAGAVYSKLENVKMIKLEDALKLSEPLDAKMIGLISNQQGKGVSRDVIEFVSDVLPAGNVENIEYLFSVCTGISRPYHSLKIIERLCMKNGLAISFNYFVDAANRADEIKIVTQKVNNGEIKLATGSFFTRLYMFFKGIK